MIEKILEILKNFIITEDESESIEESLQNIITSLISDGTVSAQIALLSAYDEKEEEPLSVVLKDLYSELITPEDDNNKIIINSFCTKVPDLPPAFTQDEVLI